MRGTQAHVAALAVITVMFGAGVGCTDGAALPDGAAADSGGGMDASVDGDAGGGDAADTGGADGPTSDAPADAADTGRVIDGSIPVRCLPQAVGGAGGCDMLLGIQWNGRQCTELRGCTCTGADCLEVYATLVDCWAERRGCAGLCGGESASPVGPCDREWGPYWDGLSCETFTGCDCAGEDCTRGYETKPECELLNRSCLGKCEGQLAMGVGACERVIGVFWDGAECLTIGGCSCTGKDCSDAYESPELCYFAHRGCSP